MIWMIVELLKKNLLSFRRIFSSNFFLNRKTDYKQWHFFSGVRRNFSGGGMFSKGRVENFWLFLGRPFCFSELSDNDIWNRSAKKNLSRTQIFEKKAKNDVLRTFKKNWPKICIFRRPLSPHALPKAPLERLAPKAPLEGIFGKIWQSWRKIIQPPPPPPPLFPTQIF